MAKSQSPVPNQDPQAMRIKIIKGPTCYLVTNGLSSFSLRGKDIHSSLVGWPRVVCLAAGDDQPKESVSQWPGSFEGYRSKEASFW